jgi:FMN-dependent NADH-azoreductase
MKKVLVINSSVRAQNSHSRKLTEMFVNHWKNLHENAVITFREIGTVPVPHITENWVAAAFKPEQTRTEEDIETLQTSNTFIAELRESDIIVVAAPMYNWSIPSSLKAYLDQVLRVNETFRIDTSKIKNPYLGLLENKTLFLLVSRGSTGYEKGGFNEHLNFQSKYLKTAFGMMGIHNTHLITVDGTAIDAATLEKNTAKAHQDIKNRIDEEVL